MSIFFKQQKNYFQSITELITVYRILLWKIWIFAPKIKKCVYFSWFSSTVQYNRREIVALCMTYKIFRGTLRESPFAKIQFWYKNIELSRWRLVKLKAQVSPPKGDTDTSYMLLTTAVWPAKGYNFTQAVCTKEEKWISPHFLQC